MGFVGAVVGAVGGVIAFEMKEMITEPQGFIPIIGGWLVGDKTFERTMWGVGGAAVGYVF